MKRLQRIAARGTATAVGACLLVLLVQPAPALANTSTARAQAVTLTLLGGTAATPVSAADNNGEQETQISGAAPTLGLLGRQPLITAGALVQKAVAYPDGTSTSCAGLVGTGGWISVGADGSCTASGGGGLQIDLAGLATIKADAIIASCRAAAGQPPAAEVTLANASVLLLGLPLRDLSPATAPNTGLDIPGVATLVVNARSAPADPASIRATALRISQARSVLAADLGIATCGENAVIQPVPVPSLPVVGAVVGAALWFGRHRLRDLSSTLRMAR
ncbi:choice-of-anchor P family protein [Catenuloplanes sp. NPDC051500]|uniref:choice-of-anchor P family protein n=1 Tax=Catenuloplanes sp. NPDC051500 TaxID=3363959 RepID=UPI0037A34A44